MRAARALIAAVALAAPAAACDEGMPATLRPCSIVETSCQREVFLATDRLRGNLWDPWSVPPAVEVVSPEEYFARSQARAGSLPRAASSDLWSGSLQDLGLLSGDLDVATADQLWFAETIANYRSRPNRVTIVDRGVPLDGVSATQTLVHEYVHALQDRDLGLDFLPFLTTDQEMVRTALIEGEAVLFGVLAFLMMEGRSREELDWRALFSGWLAGERAFMPFVASPHSQARLSFPYPTGGALLTQSYVAGGLARVERLFRAHPRSFLELMRAAEGLPPPVGDRLALDCTYPRRVGPFTVVAVDTLGAALFYAHLLHTAGDEEQAWQSAFSWRGDRAWLMAGEAGRPLTTFWRVHAPTLGSAPLGPLLRERREPPLLDGEDLLFWQGLAPEEVALATAGLTCAPGAR